ncbi:hypothetical protein BJP36_39445 [Moorena producens JHB]|uniref:Uncharacterized protein n=1 Tax=Moorena producens (strain JHB) TaxID=1454205 RepID=A0A9Q9UWQ3_MOOP1|nr:hypothetical protein [Moorena producens]WAN70131.1 hypothetical protein BJP36_39445 [Moorena producens JHB]
MKVTGLRLYSVYRSYEVFSSLTLIPCLHAPQGYSLFPITYSLFPVPCSLFPKIHKLCTS